MLEDSTTKCSNCWTKLLLNITFQNIRLHINIIEDKSLEGTGGGLQKHHELYFKVDNRAVVSAVASKTRCSSKIWRSARMVAIATSCVRAIVICFSATRCY